MNDRVAMNTIQTSLKVANSITGITGIAILLYSIWIIIVCLRDYQKYDFPWFLWACVGSGIIYCFTASVGHAAAHNRSNFLLSCYILFLFGVLLMESLITADVCLNDNWDKDFPKDPTERFDDFVDYVDSNFDFFKWLGLLILFSQVTSFVLAMILRTTASGIRSYDNNHDGDQLSANRPFLDHHIHIQPPPYVVGQPYYPATHNNVLDTTTTNEKDFIPYPEKEVWLMAGNPCSPYIA